MPETRAAVDALLKKQRNAQEPTTSTNDDETTLSSSANQPTTYTDNGRTSKAKKGVRIHICHCGKSYTRAEHLRRHQKSHTDEKSICDFPGCTKSYLTAFSLQRHKKQHQSLDSSLSTGPSPKELENQGHTSRHPSSTRELVEQNQLEVDILAALQAEDDKTTPRPGQSTLVDEFKQRMTRELTRDHPSTEEPIAPSQPSSPTPISPISPTLWHQVFIPEPLSPI